MDFGLNSEIFALVRYISSIGELFFGTLKSVLNRGSSLYRANKYKDFYNVIIHWCVKCTVYTA